MPSAVLKLTDLVLLDLSFNSIEALPPSIIQLTALENFWVNDNPLKEIPVELAGLRRLRVLDLSNTEISVLPCALCRLTRLVRLELRGTPLEEEAGRENDGKTSKILATLSSQDRRKRLRSELEDVLSTQRYRKEAARPIGAELLPPLIETVSASCGSLDVLRDIVRHSNRLFPENFELAKDPEAVLAQILKDLELLKRENAMQRLSADLELKLRALYYDRIDPVKVEGIIRDIYQHVTLLEDVQFIIARAPAVFPESPEAITGRGVREAMEDLQDRLRSERAGCIDALFKCLTAHYFDQEPQNVHDVTCRVAASVSRGRFPDKLEIERLKQLSADCSTMFPQEISEVDPGSIKRELVQRSLGRTTTAS